MKKLIPVLLSLFMLLTMTGTALAATVYTEDALNYTIMDESITIIGYFGKDAEVTIPASIAGVPVNTIAKGAFMDNSNVKTVNLPDTITTVEEGAFAAGITVNYNSNIGGGDKPDDQNPDDNKSGDHNQSTDNDPADNKPAGSKSDDNNSGTAGSTSGGTSTGTGASNGAAGNAGTAGNSSGTNGNGIDEGEVFVDDTSASGNGQAGVSDPTGTAEETAASDEVTAQQNTGFSWLWVMLGVIVAAVVCVVVIIAMKKKKK